MKQEQEGRDLPALQNLIDSNVKEVIFNQLTPKKEKELKNSLVQAALAFHRFPREIEQELFSLQQAYTIHRKTESVAICLKQAIEAYIEEKGYQEFRKILQQPFEASEWTSELLIFLANSLHIPFESNPLIQGTVYNGKVYWKVFKEGKVLCTPQPDFVFDEKNVWYMTWQDFRLFHDSGKRSGTVEITKKRFVDSFPKNKQPQAAAVWEELKTANILTDKNRLSSTWSATTNITIELNSLLEISSQEVWEELQNYKNNNSILSRDTFIGKWVEDYYQHIAGLIWDKLKKEGVITKNNKVEKTRPRLKDFLQTLHLTYHQIAKHLYAISNDQNYQQRFGMISTDATKYRPLRDVKDWCETGKINNDLTPEWCVKLWDVSTYHNLDARRNTEEERKHFTDNSKLDYDHIPSADALKRFADIALEKYDEKEESLKNDREKIKGEIDGILSEQEESVALRTKHKTRIKYEDDPRVEELKKEKEDINNKINQLNIETSEIGKEKVGHGLRWWTIAIPERLHQQGITFMQSAADQQNSTDLFLKELLCYFNILEKRYQEFSLSRDDYLKALGAFRYLFRQQVKTHKPIQEERYSIGLVPYTFFQNQDKVLKQKIDDVFNEKIAACIIKREGRLS